jgi:rhodanese-related sulfurtransferase
MSAPQAGVPAGGPDRGQAQPVGVDRLLARARARLHRVGPEQAVHAVRAGALLVDIRPAAQRATFGEIPGSLVLERNVLEWRLDPAGEARIPEATGYDRPVVVFCQEGYASSLAAEALADIGLDAATDLDGGYAAWQRAGLPVRVAQPPTPAGEQVPGA